MSFLLAIVALVAAGLALLRLMGLATGRHAVDLPLGWFVGGGWFATAIAGLRLIAGVPYTRLVALLVLAVPVLAFLVSRGRTLFSRGARTSARATRVLPRPAWLFAPIAAYVLVMAWAVSVHGINTPTETDDGARVRAFTPVLAFEDRWSPEARSLVPVAGTVPTWVPTLAGRLTGEYDTFHVNYTIVTGFLALLVLLVGLGTSRAAPERGWAWALAVLSLPLFVYHCTATYTDAVLAFHLGAGFVFFLEYERERDPADAARALLLFVVAAFVKREGATLAAACALPLLYSLVRERGRGAPIRFGALAVLLLPLLVDGFASIVSVGMRESFPVLRLLGSAMAGSTVAAGAEPHDPELRARALGMLVPALFTSGNAGMLYWILVPAIAVHLGRLRAAGRTLALFALAILLALWAVNSVLIVPAFSVDQSTIHRALMVVSVPVSLWVAAILSEPSPACEPPSSNAAP